jgi:hypothetical protein
MNSSPLRSEILQPLSPERAAGTQQVDKISVSSGNTSSLVLNANLWAVALGSKLSAGYRLAISEIESALVSQPGVAQAAVVGRPDEIKGQAIARRQW